MRHATILEQVDFRRAFEPDADIRLSPAAIAEAAREHAMSGHVRIMEAAHELGAPARVIAAGPEAAAAYVRRAGMRAEFGLPIDPEAITRAVTLDFRRQHLAETERAVFGALAMQAPDATERCEAYLAECAEVLAAVRASIGASAADPAALADLHVEEQGLRQRVDRIREAMAEPEGETEQDPEPGEGGGGAGTGESDRGYPDDDDDGDDDDDPDGAGLRESTGSLGLSRGPLVEAGSLAGANTAGQVYVARDVTLIRPGFSSNTDKAGRPRYYSAEVLKASVGLFEGARMFSNHPRKSAEKDLPERDIRDVVGWLQNVKVGPHGELRGDARFVGEAREWLWPLIQETERMPNLVELSINGVGESAIGAAEGTPAIVVQKLTAISSVDVVTSGAAGGSFAGAVLASARGA